MSKTITLYLRVKAINIMAGSDVQFLYMQQKQIHWAAHLNASRFQDNKTLAPKVISLFDRYKTSTCLRSADAQDNV